MTTMPLSFGNDNNIFIFSRTVAKISSHSISKNIRGKSDWMKRKF